MKIVSWNCGGDFFRKFSDISELDADVYIIQNCENPTKSEFEDYKDWAGNHLWVGGPHGTGIGVFSKGELSLVRADVNSTPFEWFLPCIVGEEFHLLAVWTRAANSPTFPYIGQLWKWLQRNHEFLEGGNSGVVGDFNSNGRYVVWDRWWNHHDVVTQLFSLGLNSLYHVSRSESHGNESEPTSYAGHLLSEPDHTDYAFLSEKILPSSSLEISSTYKWRHLSNHMPLIIRA